MQHQSGDDIGVFLAVCAAGSFAGAAARLHVTSSAVAKSVAKLEARLRVRLFHRTTRRLSMTIEGEIYFQSCRRARDEIARAEELIAGLTAEPAGLVSISLPPLFGTEVVAPALMALCDKWPRLMLRLGTSIEPVDVEAGEFDLAVRIGDLPDRAGLMARYLGEQDLILCGSRDYFSNRAVPDDIEDLATHALIGRPAGKRSGMGAAAWPLLDKDGTQIAWSPPARLLLEGSLLTLSAVRAGQGIGLLPHWLVRNEITDGVLVPVIASRVAGGLPVHAIWPAAHTMLPRLRVAIDTIVAVTGTVLKRY